MAAERGAPLVAADFTRLMAGDLDFAQALVLLLREAWLRDAVLYLEGLDALRTDDRVPHQRQLVAALDQSPVFTILSGARPWAALEHRPLGVVEHVFTIPAFAERRLCWQGSLGTAGIEIADNEVTALADRFRLTPWQIADAVATARQRLAGRNGDGHEDQQPMHRELFAAARLETGSDLDTLARRLEPRHTWNDIVLAEDPRGQLLQVGARVRCRQRVFGDWGFARRLGSRTGVNALFSGPPGTGKTMAAEVLASDLGLDLYKIDLSSVVSKYIGETEKNLERIFTAAENANVILFFDEADALFGKRSEVRDSHDRYANVEISYLLQRMEEYDGLAILASNLRQNMDEAFVRRLHFIVEFPFPDEEDRRRIWDVHFPAELPREADVDTASLARSYKLTGGSIRSIVLDAAFLAAAEGRAVSAQHLVRAARREYQKMGKVPPELASEREPVAARAGA
jgi:Cdc6-like AAA superfamily ATPase